MGAEECGPGRRPAQGTAPVTARACPPTGRSYDDFHTCCRVLDACYGTCGAPAATCRQDYKKCLQNVCKLSSEKAKCELDRAALAGRFDDGAHRDAQRRHCDCVKDVEVPSRYVAVAKTFLQRASWKVYKKTWKDHYQRRTKEFNAQLLTAGAGDEWKLLYATFRSMNRGLPPPDAPADDGFDGGDDGDL